MRARNQAIAINNGPKAMVTLGNPTSERMSGIVAQPRNTCALQIASVWTGAALSTLHPVQDFFRGR
jgi:hypothetical protein